MATPLFPLVAALMWLTPNSGSTPVRGPVGVYEVRVTGGTPYAGVTSFADAAGGVRIDGAMSPGFVVVSGGRRTLMAFDGSWDVSAFAAFGTAEPVRVGLLRAPLVRAMGWGVLGAPAGSARIAPADGAAVRDVCFQTTYSLTAAGQVTMLTGDVLWVPPGREPAPFPWGSAASVTTVGGTSPWQLVYSHAPRAASVVTLGVGQSVDIRTPPSDAGRWVTAWNTAGTLYGGQATVDGAFTVSLPSAVRTWVPGRLLRLTSPSTVVAPGGGIIPGGTVYYVVE